MTPAPPLTPADMEALTEWANRWAPDGHANFRLVLRLIEEWRTRGTMLGVAAERVGMCSELLGKCAGRNPELKDDVERFLEALK